MYIHNRSLSNQGERCKGRDVLISVMNAVSGNTLKQSGNRLARGIRKNCRPYRLSGPNAALPAGRRHHSLVVVLPEVRAESSGKAAISGCPNSGLQPAFTESNTAPHFVRPSLVCPVG